MGVIAMDEIWLDEVFRVGVGSILLEFIKESTQLGRKLGVDQSSSNLV